MMESTAVQREWPHYSISAAWSTYSLSLQQTLLHLGSFSSKVSHVPIMSTTGDLQGNLGFTFNTSQMISPGLIAGILILPQIACLHCSFIILIQDFTTSLVLDCSCFENQYHMYCTSSAASLKLSLALLDHSCTAQCLLTLRKCFPGQFSF